MIPIVNHAEPGDYELDYDYNPEEPSMVRCTCTHPEHSFYGCLTGGCSCRWSHQTIPYELTDLGQDAADAAGSNDMDEHVDGCNCEPCFKQWLAVADAYTLIYNACCPECRQECGTSHLDCSPPDGPDCVEFVCDNCGGKVAEGHGPRCTQRRESHHSALSDSYGLIDMVEQEWEIL